MNKKNRKLLEKMNKDNRRSSLEKIKDLMKYLKENNYKA